MTRKTTLVSVTCLIVVSISVLLACVRQPAPGQEAVATPGTVSRQGWPEAQAGQRDWQSILKEAAKEGVVTVYSGAGPEVKDALARGLKNKYGLEAQFVTGREAELVAKITAERRAGLFFADALISGGGNLVTVLKPAGVLAPLEPHLVLPEVTDPKAWPGGKFPYYDKHNLSTPLTMAYWSYILVNSDLVKDGAIKSYLDLVKPEWKGKIVMFDPVQGGVARTMCAYLLNFIFGYEKGEQFLRDLVKQDPLIVKDARLLVEWVARGRYPVGLAASMAVVPQFRASGAPVKWARVAEGGLVSPASSIFAVADRAPHPNAATVLTNWLLTAEGQAAFSQSYGQPATRLGVPATGIDPFQSIIPGEKIYPVDEDFYTTNWEKAAVIIDKVFAPVIK